MQRLADPFEELRSLRQFSSIAVAAPARGDATFIFIYFI
ncbi:hypothetical protein RTCIAT899_PC05575 (plasmid) [Rhizobium tropici CIAT 899]|nr:hypothetical protein RTCIAT899_PC05575 [Rhizobium tropici CIAT 899]